MFTRKNKRINNREPLKIWFWSLLGVFILCFFSYGYCVSSAIVNIVERQNIENELATLNSKILDLESQYITAKNSITPELAANLGFVPVSSQKFVNKTINKPGLSLVINNN
jgi:hypothetical protein